MAGRWVRPSVGRWLSGLLVSVVAVAAVSGLVAILKVHVPVLSLLVLVGWSFLAERWFPQTQRVENGRRVLPFAPRRVGAVEHAMRIMRRWRGLIEARTVSRISEDAPRSAMVRISAEVSFNSITRLR